MPGLGTIINMAGIIIGGVFGLLFGKKLNDSIQETLMTACGICVLFLGIGGAMEKMLEITSEGLVAGGTMMVIVSIALGALVGEWMDIDGKMERFGVWLRHKTGY